MLHTENKYLGDIIKTQRLRKNYTQQQLANLCGLSLRSVQRIERDVVKPRDYTLKVLSKHLELSFEEQVLKQMPVESGPLPVQKFIASVGAAVLIILLGIAYVFQSATFPETLFETTLYVAVLTSVYFLVLWFIWHK